MLHPSSSSCNHTSENTFKVILNNFQHSSQKMLHILNQMAEPVLPLSLILLKKRHKHNKEDKAFLPVELNKELYREIPSIAFGGSAFLRVMWMDDSVGRLRRQMYLVPPNYTVIAKMENFVLCISNHNFSTV
jgi:hypothetical protein